MVEASTKKCPLISRLRITLMWVWSEAAAAGSRFDRLSFLGSDVEAQAEASAHRKDLAYEREGAN